MVLFKAPCFLTFFVNIQLGRFHCKEDYDSVSSHFQSPRCGVFMKHSMGMEMQLRIVSSISASYMIGYLHTVLGFFKPGMI